MDNSEKVASYYEQYGRKGFDVIQREQLLRTFGPDDAPKMSQILHHGYIGGYSRWRTILYWIHDHIF